MKLLKKVARFFRVYHWFGLALISAGIALALDMTGRDAAAHWLLTGAVAIEVLPLAWGMWQDIRQGTYGVDILAITAIVTAVLMHEYWAGIVVVLMLTGGEALEDYAERRAKKELSALLERAPQTAHLLRGNQEIEVHIEKVRSGDKLAIRPGEVVPVDAEIIEGESSFDESSLTGESLPQVHQTGAQIMSGSVNLDGAITVRALHAAKDSQYEQIIKLVRAASKSQAPFVRLADHYAIPFTIVSFSIAALAWALSGEALRFLEVLVVATPCPLILAAPIAIISGMSRAAKHGIIIRTGSALERLALIKTLAFDKTGTLTRGQPQVEQITTYHSYKHDEVLRLAAAVEQKSGHVLGRAIVAAAQAADIRIPKAKNVHEQAGHGLSATTDGKAVLVGRLSLLRDHGVAMPATFNPKKMQSTATFVAVQGRLAGIITFTDEIRTEAKSTLQRLRGLGIDNLLMVTGDHKTTAKVIAKKLGIAEVHAEMLPAGKIHAVERAEKPVGFVGDGVNDAPVLTASDVGIALGARGSTAASESADVVIMQDDLGKVATSIEIAQRSFFIAKQSIGVGIALSILLMLVFSTGKFLPIQGAFVQEVVDVVVIFNALRAHGKKR